MTRAELDRFFTRESLMSALARGIARRGNHFHR